MLLTSFLSWLRQAPRSVVDVVDDPEGSIRLVRLRGLVTSAALLDLLEAGTERGAPRRCHVDLFDARITAAPIMHELGRTVDYVERHGVAVRVVGIDPHHPALSS